MLISVEVSTLDFDSNIPGSNPGRTTSRNSTVVVHRTCNAKVLSSILSCGLATTSTSAREVQGAGFRHQCVRTRGLPVKHPQNLHRKCLSWHSLIRAEELNSFARHLA